MEANYTPSMNTYTNLGAFRFWCQKVLPLVYDDSLSYYELLCKVVHYLNETIENMDMMGEDISKLHTAYTELEQFINTYFDNLDVQNEIDAKLNRMATDGSLSVIIQPLFDGYKAEISGELNRIDNKGSNNASNIAVLSSRVDAFTNLPNGSTTGDAEVADGRVAYDGTTHANSGGATRYSDTRLHDTLFTSVTNLTDRDYMRVVYKTVMGELNPTAGEGYLHGNTGARSGSTTYPDVVCTDYVNIYEHPVLYVTGRYSHLAAIVAIYDVNKTFLGAVYNGVNVGEEGYDTGHRWTRQRFTLLDALSMDKRATYARFSSFVFNTSHPALNVEVIDEANSISFDNYFTMNQELNNANVNTNIKSFNSILGDVGFEKGYLSRKYGTVSSDVTTGKVSNFIKLTDYPELFVTADYGMSTAVFGLYDANQNMVYTRSNGGETSTDLYYTFFKWDNHRFTIFDALAINQDAVYVRFGSYTGKGEAHLDVCTAIRESQKAIDATSCGNVLYGKKYVACGDSWTGGDWTGWTDENGLSGVNSPVIYDTVTREWKTYPWWITQRNNMTLVNEAIGGSTVALTTSHLNDPTNYDEKHRNPFSVDRYKAIPEDADYITLLFGINDSANTNLGSIDDTTNETFYGAFNVVMEWLLTNRPYAKIGLIVTHAGKASYRQDVREIGVKWGVPVLDLMGSETPTIFGKENGLCSKANTLRNNAFRVSSTNSHPNIEAHKQMSTFIEAFLRRL